MLNLTNTMRDTFQIQVDAELVWKTFLFNVFTSISAANKAFSLSSSFWVVVTCHRFKFITDQGVLSHFSRILVRCTKQCQDPDHHPHQDPNLYHHHHHQLLLGLVQLDFQLCRLLHQLCHLLLRLVWPHLRKFLSDFFKREVFYLTLFFQPWQPWQPKSNY